MRKLKKAQLQLGENVVVLIIFFFLLVVAVIFYAGIQKSRFSAKKIESQSIALLDLKTLVASMPELLCTENTDVTIGCIDLINLQAMSAYWKSIENNTESVEREYYRYRFEMSEITIKKFDALSNSWTSTWTLYNNTLDDATSSRMVFIPVSLYNATSNEFSFGIVEVRRFSR